MDVGLDPLKRSQEMTFFVEGVRCSKCVHKLENLPLQQGALQTSRFNKSRNLLTLSSPTELSPPEVIQWIEDLGYKAYYVESSAQTEKLRRGVHRQWLIRLAVTFFFASNLMMFAIALYMGAYGPWKSYFGWACGLLFLPVLFYSAIPFYQSAFLALKQRRFSADVAIVIAFLWGSSLSYFNLLRGEPDFYFDSTASFLFLILLARFLLDKAQNSLESDLNPSLLFKAAPLFQTGSSNAKNSRPVFYHQVQAQDVLRVQQGQTIPVDLTLMSNAVEIDTSLFSGESFPQTFYKGSTLKAGMILLSKELEGQAQGTFQDSELQRIFDGVLRNRHEKTKAHAKAEIYSQRLLLTVSTLSLGLLLFFGLHGDWAEGFRRALALFTIACPCALALAIPLASVITLKRAMEQGLFVKSPLFFEKLREIDGIVFDKTGTLTQGQLALHSWNPVPSDDLKELLLALEQNSHHPMARSLTQILRKEGLNPKTLDHWEEIPGFGVRGRFQNEEYSLHQIQSPLHKNLTGFQLTKSNTKNTEPLVTVYFKDEIRPEAKDLLARLKKKGLEIHLLSGDRTDVVASVAQELGFEQHQTHSPMNPEAKATFFSEALLKENKNYLMVGDGHNDALAMSQAMVSLAVKGSAETSLRAADAYSQKNDLRLILTALNLSSFYHRLITQNVGLSLTYNLIAGAMAMAGLVDPLMAAVLMPLNSFVVIGATFLAHPPKTKEI